MSRGYALEFEFFLLNLVRKIYFQKRVITSTWKCIQATNKIREAKNLNTKMALLC